jgi:hypothetical protein
MADALTRGDPRRRWRVMAYDLGFSAMIIATLLSLNRIITLMQS